MNLCIHLSAILLGQTRHIKCDFIALKYTLFSLICRDFLGCFWIHREKTIFLGAGGRHSSVSPFRIMCFALSQWTASKGELCVRLNLPLQ